MATSAFYGLAAAAGTRNGLHEMKNDGVMIFTLHERVTFGELRTIIAEALKLSAPETALMQRVEAGDYHMLPVDQVTDPKELDVLETLVMKGMLRRLLAKPGSEKLFPERWVVTSGGSHSLGTFGNPDDDISNYYNKSRRRGRK